MNQTLDVIKNRFSCRDFSDKALSEQDITLIAQAGLQAPSGMNRQGWHISMVTNQQLLAEMDAEGLRALREFPERTIYKRIMSRCEKLFYNAPCMAFISIKEGSPKGAELIDLGIIAQNIALAAESLGINSCHCGLVAFCFTGDRKEEFKSRLNVPSGYECGMGVLLGYAKSVAEPHAPKDNKITIIS